MSDGAVELILELYSLNGVQMFRRDGRREVTYDWEVKETKGVFTVEYINGFTVAAVMSKRERNHGKLWVLTPSYRSTAMPEEVQRFCALGSG